MAKSLFLGIFEKGNIFKDLRVEYCAVEKLESYIAIFLRRSGCTAFMYGVLCCRNIGELYCYIFTYEAAVLV